MKSICGSDSDIISDLHGNIIDNILACLPLRDVVRTSILSRKWRFKWATIPELDFSYLCNEHPGLLSDTHKLVTMIYQVLIHHKGPIVKFALSKLGKESFVHINHWVIFLSRNDIQDFTLRIMWGGEYYRLPIHFYSFLQLRHLNLFKCVFNPPPTFKGFSSLVSIDFHSVIIATDILLNLISSCPLLERLGLADCNKFECLDIDAPKLRILRFFGGSNTFCLKNSPHLAMAMIDLYGMTEKVHLVEGETSNFIKVFGCTIVLENLLICAGFLKFLAVGNVQKRLPITLQHLKFLHIADICFEKIDEISCALSIIRSSPNLQKLKFSAFTDSSAPMERAVEYIQMQDFSGCSLSQLRTFKMRRVSGVKPEMEFLKLILANSAFLEKMIIRSFEGYVTDGGLEMLKELTRFPRASPKAEIMFDPE